ncbi:MAG: SGNH/GDSL hydrolase family protein [Alistipes sp.]|nr:SGNH/GDSL hydrolase family protein [Alistipes sp.]
MKNFLSNFLRFFFGSPVLPVMAVMCSVFIVFFTADSFIQLEEEAPDYTITMSAFSLGEAVVESTSCTTASTTAATVVSTSGISDSTSAEAAYTTTTAESVAAEKSGEETASGVPEVSDNGDSEEAPVYKYEYLSAGESANSVFYQDRLVIIGDSIAYGFNAYGYIPPQHNIAKESLAVWNMGSYTFDLGGGAMGLIDAAAYANSSLYYVSIGMNDIYSFTPGDYAWNIRWIAEDVLAHVPTATIVVGTITPVSDGNYYTTNDTINEFNAALEAVINDLGSSRVLFFDANAALKDLGTGALSYDYAGGDGLHLNSSAYSRVLDCLFNFLDSTEAVDQINEHEHTR